jgi:hypothetical protein
METETVMETETDMERKLTIHGHGHRSGHGIGELLLSIPYGAIVPIAPYEMPRKYHGAISNGAIDL